MYCISEPRETANKKFRKWTEFIGTDYILNPPFLTQIIRRSLDEILK